MNENGRVVEYQGKASLVWVTVCKVPVCVRATRPGVPFDVHTLEGVMHGNADDWLIEGVNGELYPCKPDIFAKTYELVS